MFQSVRLEALLTIPVVLLVLLLAPAMAEAATSTATLKIAGITCQAGCVPHVQQLLEEIPGVTRVRVEFEGYATIEFDPDLTGPEALARALEQRSKGRYLARPVAEQR